jgi:alkane 1-monooxygenase
MDPLVVQHYKGDLTRANLYPPKREELLARWSKPGAMPAPAPEVFPGAHVAVDAPVAAGGSYQCTDCGYIYEEAKGCPHEGFPAGTPWAQIPDDWPCPDCAVRDKVDFRKL